MVERKPELEQLSTGLAGESKRSTARGMGGPMSAAADASRPAQAEQTADAAVGGLPAEEGELVVPASSGWEGPATEDAADAADAVKVVTAVAVATRPVAPHSVSSPLGSTPPLRKGRSSDLPTVPGGGVNRLSDGRVSAAAYIGVNTVLPSAAPRVTKSAVKLAPELMEENSRFLTEPSLLRRTRDSDTFDDEMLISAGLPPRSWRRSGAKAIKKRAERRPVLALVGVLALLVGALSAIVAHYQTQSNSEKVVWDNGIDGQPGVLDEPRTTTQGRHEDSRDVKGAGDMKLDREPASGNDSVTDTQSEGRSRSSSQRARRLAPTNPRQPHSEPLPRPNSGQADARANSQPAPEVAPVIPSPSGSSASTSPSSAPSSPTPPPKTGPPTSDDLADAELAPAGQPSRARSEADSKGPWLE